MVFWSVLNKDTSSKWPANILSKITVKTTFKKKESNEATVVGNAENHPVSLLAL